MIDVINSKGIIVNVVNVDVPKKDSERPHYPWGWVGDVWTERKPLSFSKVEKLKVLKKIRDGKEQEVVSTNLGVFDFNKKSRERINNAIVALRDSGLSVSWTLADDKVVDVGVSDLEDVVKTAAMRSNELHEHYRRLKTKVNECVTVAEVEAIKWEDINDG